MEYMKYEVLEPGISRMWIDRPKALNAMNSVVIAEMDEMLESISSDKALKVLIVGGEANFAAGADIKEMINNGPDQALKFCFTPTFNKLMELEIPTIAAVDGYALGGGVELAMCCDMRIITEDAVMGQPEINLGILPGGGGNIRLPRLVGVPMAMELILTGRNVRAEEAVRIGLANKAVPKDQLLAECLKLAQRIAAKPQNCVRAAKEIITQGLEYPNVGTATYYEREEWAKLFGTPNQKKGMSAFIEKRPANFV